MKRFFPALFLLSACAPVEDEELHIRTVTEACDEACVLAAVQTLSDVLFEKGHAPYEACAPGLTVDILAPGDLGDEGPGLYRNTEHPDVEIRRTVQVEVGEGIPSEVLVHELFHDYEAYCLENAEWVRYYARRFGGHFVWSAYGFEIVDLADQILTTPGNP